MPTFFLGNYADFVFSYVPPISGTLLLPNQIKIFHVDEDLAASMQSQKREPFINLYGTTLTIEGDSFPSSTVTFTNLTSVTSVVSAVNSVVSGVASEKNGFLILQSITKGTIGSLTTSANSSLGISDVTVYGSDQQEVFVQNVDVQLKQILSDMYAVSFLIDSKYKTYETYYVMLDLGTSTQVIGSFTVKGSNEYASVNFTSG